MLDERPEYSGYYTWLLSLIEPPQGVDSPIRLYGMLIYELWRREFFWMDIYEGEESRAADGRQLREQYMMEADVTPDFVPIGPCTVLEMLIAFALRLDSTIHDWTIGHRPWEWMTMFITNLGLADLTDNSLRAADRSFVTARLEMWMAHNIGTRGERGLFRFKRPLLTISNLDNWSQMQHWVGERLS